MRSRARYGRPFSTKDVANVGIDLKPNVQEDALTAALSQSRGKASLATFLRKAAHLSPQAIGLLQEAAHRLGEPLAPLDARALARRIKHVPVTLSGVAPIARAISSAGGVMRAGLDDGLMLESRPGVFVAGEMLDWEAPTGGYLLQASFASGVAAGRAAAAYLQRGRL